MARGDLERVARKSFALVLAAQKPPPSYVKDAGANILTDAGAPSAWLQRVGEGEDQTVVSEPLALVPLVGEVLAGPGAANSVLGAPPPQKAGNRGEGPHLAAASRDLEAGYDSSRLGAHAPAHTRLYIRPGGVVVFPEQFGFGFDATG